MNGGRALPFRDGTGFAIPASMGVDIHNVTFYKGKYTGDIGVDAAYSVGSPAGTFTATRGASNPATNVDAGGLLSKNTTSDDPRFCGGYYDTSGFNSYPGLMMEIESKNWLTYSEDMTHADWGDGANTTEAANSAVAPDGNTTADTIISGAAASTFLQDETWLSTANTFSIWLKRKGAGTGDVSITCDGGTTPVVCSLSTTEWRRFTATQTNANPSVGILFEDDTDEVYAWGAQLEKGKYATSYIPTTSAELTRNHESLTYPCANNILPNLGTVIIKALTFGPSDTGSKQHIRISATGGYLIMRLLEDDIQYNWGALESIAYQVTVNAFTSHVVGISYDRTTTIGYYNGSNVVSDTTANLTSLPASMHIGSAGGASEHLDGIIQAMIICNRALTANEVSSVSTFFSNI